MLNNGEKSASERIEERNLGHFSKIVFSCLQAVSFLFQNIQYVSLLGSVATFLFTSIVLLLRA